MGTVTRASTDELEIEFELLGGNAEAFLYEGPDVVVCGPAGTGKTTTNCEWAHKLCMDYPNVRGLFLRKTFASLKATTLITFDEFVQPTLDGVVFRSATSKRPPMYVYPNGSTIVIGGIDQWSKLMGADYDFILVFEATELEETDDAALSTRLRGKALPFRQLRRDCNPGAPTHWIKAKIDAGKVDLIESRHEDNPSVTPDYLARLDALPPVLYLRFRKGLWAAAEGVVYGHVWDPKTHIIDRFPIPPEWPRYWCIDWGYSHPFVWQCWARDNDGRLYREHEVYMSHRTVPEHWESIKRIVSGTPSAYPSAIICDPEDAGSRALFEQYSRMGTVAAEKAVRAGITAVMDRLRLAGDGKPRLYYLRDTRYEIDPSLAELHLPTCTEQEYEVYVWPPLRNTALGASPNDEVPVKDNDHGLDATRYMVAYFDIHDTEMSYVRVPGWG